MKNWGLVSLITIMSSVAWGHALMINPVPRNNNAGNKVAPCGPTAKAAVPTVTVAAGATLAIAWRETINHPGKYIFSWLQENDTPMAGVAPVLVPDNQDNPNNLPHNYTAVLTVPNVVCNNCTLQMVQSMEENPNVPTFYYSCVDIRITAAGATPTPGPTGTPLPTLTPPGTGGVSAQDATLRYDGEKTVVGASCGTVASKKNGGGFGGGAGMLALLFPFMVFLILRSKTESRAAVSVSRDSGVDRA